MTVNIIKAAFTVMITNMPFGFWRANSKKFSRDWFLAVHIPVILVVILRFYFEIGFEFFTYPILILSFLSGQFFGGILKKLWTPKGKS
jgi:hypothetical protein